MRMKTGNRRRAVRFWRGVTRKGEQGSRIASEETVGMLFDVMTLLGCSGTWRHHKPHKVCILDCTAIKEHPRLGGRSWQTFISPGSGGGHPAIRTPTCPGSGERPPRWQAVVSHWVLVTPSFSSPGRELPGAPV